MKTPPQRLRTGLSLGATIFLLTSAATAADDAALQRCRAIAEAGARLACYDALASALPARDAPLAAPAVAPSPVLAPAAVQSFGQERRERREEPQSLDSHIAGAFEGWGPTSRIKLANGQVWQVVDGSEGVYFLQSPKVTVKRALLGGFQLEIEGAKRAPRVRRVE